MGLTTLDRIDAKAKQQMDGALAQAKATWRELVIEVADGKKVDEQTTLDTLAAINKTTADLRAAAALLLQRREWLAQARRGPEIDAEFRELEARGKELEEEAAEALARCRKQTIEINSRMNALTAERFAVEMASRKLLESADRDLLDQRNALLKESATIGKRIYWAEKPFPSDPAAHAAVAEFPAKYNLARMKADLRRLEAERDDLPDAAKSTSASYEETIASLRKQVAAAEAQVEGWRTRREQLDSQIAAIDAKLLEP